MSDEFKDRLKATYAQNSRWARILALLAPNPTQEELSAPENSPPEGLRFRLKNDLIYFTSEMDGKDRLCIPKEMNKEVFELAHDMQNHTGFHRSYERLASSVYVRKLSRRLLKYIQHCPSCQVNQTKRHAPYGSLHPITSPVIPFHTVAMDFVAALPPTKKDGFDTLLTVTCKFSKRILLIPGLSTYSAAEWADTFLAKVMGHDWGIPQGIVSDRDPKFLSELWKGIFKRMGTKMLTSTAYHPQTDGQSERTNQTVEIALRYHLTANPEDDFTTPLPYIQVTLNNSLNSVTNASLNEIVYGFKTNDTLQLLADLPAEEYSLLRTMRREEAESSIAWANAMAKHYYDAKHKPITFENGQNVFLKLHHGYSIPGLANRKLSQQRAGPFKVLAKVGRLAYRLELPPVMKIHPVISVAQLEPAPTTSDPYNRLRNTAEIAIRNRDDLEEDEWFVERLIDKKISSNKAHYLVQWSDHGPEHNAWYSVDDLTDSKELMAEFDANPPPNCTWMRSLRR